MSKFEAPKQSSITKGSNVALSLLLWFPWQRVDVNVAAGENDADARSSNMDLVLDNRRIWNGRDRRGDQLKETWKSDLQTCIDMLCILKAVIAWLILLVVGGWFAQIVRGGLFSPFPAAPTDPRVAEALRSMRRSYKRAHIAWTFTGVILVSAYVAALYHLWNLGLAASSIILMIAIIPRLGREVPRSISIVGDAILWGSSVLVWYSLCRWT